MAAVPAETPLSPDQEVEGDQEQVVAMEEEECGCVLPEQSCPACRAAAAKATRMPWE